MLRWLGGIALASASLWFMASQLSLSAAQLRAGLAQIPGWALVAAAGLFAGSVLLETLAWYRILRAVSPQSIAISPADAFALFNVSAVGKYLPGKVWGYAWQMYLLELRGVPAQRSLRANTVALVAACAAGALVGGAGAAAGRLGMVPAIASLAVAAALLMLVPLQQRLGVLSSLGRRFRFEVGANGIGRRAWIEAVTGYCAVWIVYGVGGVIVAMVVEPPLTASIAATVVAAMCLSWLIGMVVVIAPAGLGVREASMALALVHLPGRLGIVLPIATRLLLIVVDLMLEAAALAVLWYRRSESLGPGGSSISSGGASSEPRCSVDGWRMVSHTRAYQTAYSKNHPELYDLAGREVKARKVLAVLEDYVGADELAEKTALDVGCSSGIITHHLSGTFAKTWGVDIDAEAIAFANREFGSDRLRFETSDGMVLGFDDGSFDVVICSQVYEHVPDAGRLMQEIWRVLRPGGVCYFSAGNRLSLIEPHYHLPFLSVVPRPMAHAYLRLLKRGDHYYETHRTLWGLRRLTREFRVVDYTAKILREPKRFYMDDLIRQGSLLHRLAPIAVRGLYWAIPNYVWLLVK